MNSMDFKDCTPRQVKIIQLFAAVTETENTSEIREYLDKSWIFSEIGEGNEVFLYDSTSANLMDIIQGLRESTGDRLDSEKISSKTITMYNRNHYPGVGFPEDLLM